jgi:hypothetical protein
VACVAEVGCANPEYNTRYRRLDSCKPYSTVRMIIDQIGAFSEDAKSQGWNNGMGWDGNLPD